LALGLKFKSYSLDKSYFGKILSKSLGLSCNHPYIQSLILLLTPKALLNPKCFGIHLLFLCEIAKLVLLHTWILLNYKVPQRPKIIICHCNTSREWDPIIWILLPCLKFYLQLFLSKVLFPCNFESQKTLKVNEILGSIYDFFFWHF